MSGADLEYQNMLARAGIDPNSSKGYDGPLLEQVGDTKNFDSQIAYYLENGSSTNAALLNAIAAEARLVRRDSMIRAATLGAQSGGSCLFYRTSDDVRIIRPIGDGYVSEYFWRRVTATSVGTKSMVFTASHIGIPMIAVEPWNGGGSVVETGTWTTTGVNSGNTKMEAWEGFPLIREQITLSWTGSGSFTASPALSPTTANYWINRWVTIPGVASGGADAFVKISNVTGSGATVAFTSTGGTAPAGAFSNVLSSVDPMKRQTTVAGSTRTWTTPVTSYIGIIPGIASNANMIAVTINNGAVVPDSLPTAQQLVTDGRLASSALTTNGGTVDPATRIIDPYGPVSQWGVCFAVAPNLNSASYTVQTTVLSAKNVAAGTSSDFSIISGYGYSNGESALNGPGVEIFSTYRVGRFAANNELAIDTIFSGSTAAFVGGEGHGYEGQTQSLSFTVDGAVITPVNGQRVLGNNIVMRRKATVYHPSDTVNPCWFYETTYRADSNFGIGISQKVIAARDLTINSAGYVHNWDLYLTSVQGSASDTGFTTIGVADGTWIVYGYNDAIAAWDENLGSGAIAVLIVPDAKRQTGGWASQQKVAARKLQGAGVGGAPVGYPHVKPYVQIPRGPITAGTVITGEGRYIVGRDPNGTPQFPASATL